MRSSIAILALMLVGLAAPAVAPAAVYRPVVFGANTTGITDETGEALDRFAARAGRMPRIAMYYRDWDEGYRHALISPRFLEPIRSFAQVDAHDQREKIPERRGVRGLNV